jgi:glycosyltransferase involved in cell wall biosynthesis
MAFPMIRVLHIVGGLNIGGVETWLAEGLPAIDRNLYQFDFLVYGDGAQFFQDKLEANGARVWQCPPPRNLPAYVRSFLRILRANHYDAMDAHTYCSSGLALALAAWAQVPVRIFHSHTAQDESRSGIMRAVYFIFSRWLIQRYATRGAAVSQEAARPLFPKDWRDHPTRWFLAPVGIDLSPFEVIEDRAAVLRELSLPANARVIVHVGRFAAVKNHAFLLAIADEMARLDPNVFFLLVGDGELRAETEQRVNHRGLGRQFRFAGLRCDVPRLLQACDAFVFPSIYEGFPMAYIEAQAAGLPCVISTAIASAADVVESGTRRLSLDSPPRKWALTLLDAMRLQRIPGVPPQLHKVSIQQSMQRLLECYQPEDMAC